MTNIEKYYEEYATLKGWGGSLPDESKYFDQLAAKINFPKNSKIFEFGFGAGSFLRWATMRGHAPTGMELQPELVQRAQDHGARCLQGPLTDGLLPEAEYDIVLAFDVLEHLSVSEIEDFFKITLKSLKGNGLYVLRFPNGASPFALAHQNGDVTHKTVLTVDSLAQIAHRQGLEIQNVVNVRAYPGSLLGNLKRWTVYRLQDCVETVIKWAYFGGKAELAPNIVVVLKRTYRGGVSGDG